MSASINDLAAVESSFYVTVVVPTEPHGPNIELESHVTNLVQKVDKNLEEHLTAKERRNFIAHLKRYIKAIDKNNLSRGLWIGASTECFYSHILDDDVEPFVFVGDAFYLEPLVYQAQRKQALVLLLSEKKTSLNLYKHDQKAQDRLLEIRSEGFPFSFKGEGGRPARDSGSRQRDDRYRRWMRDISEAVSRVRRTSEAVYELPLIVVGIGRYVGFLSEVSSGLKISAVLEGSCDAMSLKDLDDAVGDVVETFFAEETFYALHKASRLQSSGKVVYDAADILNFSALGKVESLILEKNYAKELGLESAVVETLGHGGSVYVADSKDIATVFPDVESPRLIAILRW